MTQFGEKKARRRKLIELKIKRDNNQLFISKLKKLKFENKCDDFIIVIKIILRVDIKIV